MPNKKKLPTINQPTLVANLPISKTKIKYRPFVIREQQALMLAQQADDFESTFATIESVLTTCTDGGVDVVRLPLGDLAYLFLQLHIASVGADLVVKSDCEDSECKYPILIKLDLSTVGVSESISQVVTINSDVGIKFRYPTYADTLELSRCKATPIKGIFHLVDQIFDAESVYLKSDYTYEEFEQWFLDLNDEQIGKIYKFVEDIPDLFYDLVYQCPKCKKEHSKRLEGLQTFFRLSYEYRLSGRLLQDEHNSDDGVRDIAE